MIPEASDGTHPKALRDKSRQIGALAPDEMVIRAARADQRLSRSVLDEAAPSATKMRSNPERVERRRALAIMVRSRMARSSDANKDRNIASIRPRPFLDRPFGALDPKRQARPIGSRRNKVRNLIAICPRWGEAAARLAPKGVLAR